MLKFINLSKSFASQDLFSDVNFIINQKERIGLVGRNGHGKSTLLKMILGGEQADTGEIVAPKHYTMGHVSQHIKFTKETVREEGALGLADHDQVQVWKVEKILFGLGFTIEDLNRHPNEFSGGFQVRLNLAKVLVSEPDLLLLDEPTNYLDVVSIRWLSQYLKQWQGELILITHDRSFMDSIITHTVGIHRKSVRKIEGTTAKYYEQIFKEEEIHEKTRLNDEKKRKEVELFVSRFRAKARLAGMVQSRIKALEKSQKLDKLDKIKNLDFSFAYTPFTAKVLSRIEHLHFGYIPDKPLVNDLSLTIEKNDRICIIGKNGKGKTTLLRLLADELNPNKGEILNHQNTTIGYYAQTNILQLNEVLTIEEELMSTGCDRQLARDISGAMMFEGDMALKKISILSGGEKSRVLLGKILAHPCNLLLLDEPTNHLDMDSCDSLLSAIDSFDGAVLMVTHNEMFLHTLATKFIVFQNDGVSIFNGTYQDFLDKVGWEEEEKPEVKRKDQNKEGVSKKDMRKLKAQIISERSGTLKPLETAINALEESIETAEKNLQQANNKMIEASSSGNSSEISELGKEIHEIQQNIDTSFEELVLLTDQYDSLSKEFDEKLEELT